MSLIILLLALSLAVAFDSFKVGRSFTSDITCAPAAPFRKELFAF